MLAVGRAMERFRTPFHGKSSPVQFFWGGLDLNATRFNGLSPAIVRGSHYGVRRKRGELRGRLLAGGRALPARRPVRLHDARARRDREGAASSRTQAGYDATLGEFVLRYDDLRRAPSPEDTIVTFFQSAYEASAALAGWDRAALEGPVPPRRAERR